VRGAASGICAGLPGCAWVPNCARLYLPTSNRLPVSASTDNGSQCSGGCTSNSTTSTSFCHRTSTSPSPASRVRSGCARPGLCLGARLLDPRGRRRLGLGGWPLRCSAPPARHLGRPTLGPSRPRVCLGWRLLALSQLFQQRYDAGTRASQLLPVRC